MKKIFICGLGPSGKGLMKQLLDGHSKTCMMPFQGFIFNKLMQRDLKSITMDPRFTSPYRTEYYKQMPYFNLIDEGITYKIYFDMFISNLYYDNELYVSSHLKRLWGEAGKGNEALVNFEFDYHQYEKDWYNRLFGKRATVTLDEFLDIMYYSFFKNWTNKYIKTRDIKGMFTTIQNGIEPITWFVKHLPDAKLLLMERDGIGSSYALANKHIVRSGKPIYSELYNLSVINQFKQYRNIIHSKDFQSNPNILSVDFNKLVLDTRNTMAAVCDFLEIDFESILIKATLNRVSLETKEVKFTGKINEDPYEFLPGNVLDLLHYFYYGPKQEDGTFKKFYYLVKVMFYKISYKISQKANSFIHLLEILRGKI